jgi:hypothetical protein
MGDFMVKARTLCVAAVFAAWAVAPSVSFSQTSTSTVDACAASEISGRGKPMAFASRLNEKTLVSIGAATLLSLSGPERDWPSGDFKLPPRCEIGQMTVGSDVYVLKRNSGDGPSIWAQSSTSKSVVFLALGPDLPSAYTWYKTNNSGGMSPKSWAYFLTVMQDGEPQLSVTRIYDDRPPLDVLKADIAATLQQQLPTIVVYDRDRQLTSVRLPSKVKDGDRFWR